jgi:hypothetical protein
MAKNVQLSLNKEEILLVSNKLNVRENEIGKSLKALLLGKENSKDFPLKFYQELKKVETKSIEQEIKDMTIQQLRKELGIDVKGKNENRKTKAGGLYFKKNTEDYLSDFMTWWHGDPRKIAEASLHIKNLARHEFMVLEYARRRDQEINL